MFSIQDIADITGKPVEAIQAVIAEKAIRPVIANRRGEYYSTGQKTTIKRLLDSHRPLESDDNESIIPDLLSLAGATRKVKLKSVSHTSADDYWFAD